MGNIHLQSGFIFLCRVLVYRSVAPVDSRTKMAAPRKWRTFGVVQLSTIWTQPLNKTQGYSISNWRMQTTTKNIHYISNNNITCICITPKKRPISKAESFHCSIVRLGYGLPQALQKSWSVLGVGRGSSSHSSIQQKTNKSSGMAKKYIHICKQTCVYIYIDSIAIHTYT